MSILTDMDLSACEREPIHIPGSIQPHGLLLVVDPASEVIVQAAGPASALLERSGSTLGETVQAVLGMTLRQLLGEAGADLLGEPTYLGSIRAGARAEDLTITAHQSQRLILLEVEPSLWTAPAPRRLAEIRSAAERLGAAADLMAAFDLAAREIHRLTKYDRVMIYQFLADGSGRVVAETKEERAPAFLSHRFPASDIPQQARALYLQSPIRVIPDVSYRPAPLLPPLCPSTRLPLDMSHCSLRSVSPVHIQYLKNLGVGASMSVSLMVGGELWGLIACHNSTPRLVPYEVREACRHVGQILSQQIRAREEAETYRSAIELTASRETVLATLRDARDPGAFLSERIADLLPVVSAHGVAAAWKGITFKAGIAPSVPQSQALAAWLLERPSRDDVFATECLSEHDAPAADLEAFGSGLLSIVVPGDDPLVVMWFRAEQVEEVHWAGNPHKPAEPGPAPGHLNPRTSFETWKETVRGRSRPWKAEEIDSGRAFRTRAGFILQQMKIRELNALLSRANASLSLMARTDGLTGVANRRAFDERLDEEWNRAIRQGAWLALISLDIDFFKQFNDRFGHLDGDECLKRIAGQLRAGRRAADFPARTGGEEFSLLLADTHLEGAVKVAEQLRASVEALRIDHPGSPMGVVTVSIGVAAIRPGREQALADLRKASDDALYEAKSQGRNRVASALLEGGAP